MTYKEILNKNRFLQQEIIDLKKRLQGEMRVNIVLLDHNRRLQRQLRDYQRQLEKTGRGRS